MLPESPIFISYSKFLSFHLRTGFLVEGMKRGPLRYSVCRQDFSSTCKDRGLLRAFFFFFKL